MYSRVPGAQVQNLSETGPIWTLPCDREINSTILFGNKSFPIHPLDMNFALTTSENQTCVGAVRIHLYGTCGHNLTVPSFSQSRPALRQTMT
jgi:hypothetical protein